MHLAGHRLEDVARSGRRCPATCLPPMKCPMFRMGALLTAVFAGRLPLPPGRGYRVRNGEREPEMASKLDQLRAMTVVVADTGDIEAVRRLKPQDCTTNPSLLLKAVEMPAYAGLFDESHGLGPPPGRRARGGHRGDVRPARGCLRHRARRHRAGPGLDRGRRRPVLRYAGDGGHGARHHRAPTRRAASAASAS